MATTAALEPETHAVRGPVWRKRPTEPGENCATVRLGACLETPPAGALRVPLAMACQTWNRGRWRRLEARMMWQGLGDR